MSDNFINLLLVNIKESLIHYSKSFNKGFKTSFISFFKIFNNKEKAYIHNSSHMSFKGISNERARELLMQRVSEARKELDKN